ncbi:MAG: SEL1-like repeat protein [Rhodocyclales bacterium]|nr:SEL1-like repeat protein [Rhodocyclales bacterium]
MIKKTTLTTAICLAIAMWGYFGLGREVQASPLTYEQAQDRAEFVLLLRKARQGDSEAQWSAAATYLRLGETSMALPLLASAAANGHVSASTQLGALHEEGRGVEKSDERAMEWYRKAAAHGDAISMAAMARLMPRADSKVAELRLRSAKAGNADAQYALGLELLGRGDERLLGESHAWFVMAAQQGHVGAQVVVGQQFLEGKAVKGDSAQGVEWLLRAARSGNPVASFLVGRAYLTEGDSNGEAASNYLRVAAEAGHREAQFLYGKLLADSKAIVDKHRAARWLEKAWSAGHVVAANRLGELLREPVEGLRQHNRARELFLHAAEKGNVDAMYNFAEMQHSGIGGERDTFEALKWYGRAADGKHERAMEVVDTLLGSSIKTSSLGLKGFWQ